MSSVWVVSLVAFLSILSAIEVTPNSSCSAYCLDNPNGNRSDTEASHTFPTDLVCNDWELDGSNSTIIGRKFRDCVECESNSTAYDPSSKENDVYWFICLSNLTTSFNWNAD